MTSSPRDQPPSDDIDAFADDPTAASFLRSSLHELRIRSAGTPLAKTIEAVLAGRISIRNLASDEQFSQLMSRGVREYDAYVAGLSPEQRADVTSEGVAADRRRSSG